MDDSYTLESASFIFTYVSFKSPGIEHSRKEYGYKITTWMHKHVIKVERMFSNIFKTVCSVFKSET